MPTWAESAKARIERLRKEAILKRFTDPREPELAALISGVVDAAPVGAIDDGADYDPQARRRPDFVAKDLIGWK